MLEPIPFSREAKQVYAEAADIARQAGKPFDTAHVLLACFTVPCEAHAILLEKHLDSDRVVDMLPGTTTEPAEVIALLYSTAARIAVNLGSPQCTSVHLVMAITRLPSSRAARVLEHCGLPMYALRTHAMAHLTDPRLRRAATERMAAAATPTPPVGTPIPTPAARIPTPRPESRPESRPGSPRGSEASPTAASLPAPVPQVACADDDTPLDFDADEPVRETRRPVAAAGARYSLDPEQFPTLCALGRNLTLDAEEGRLDPLIGRAQELDAVVDILCKRRSNNPMLLGDPGVGKTALVEGLARRIVECGDRVPALDGKIVVSLSVSDLLAGTAMRGSFAQRMKELKDEVVAAEGRVILFIDEIHTMIGAGQGDGGMDAANDLKGALARGQFPCIGATTWPEYERHILKDPALERRFEAVTLREPSLDEAEAILAGVAPRYAEHHRVRFSADALRAAVRLTDRVIPDRSLPAKAIDVLDRAGARVRRDGRDEVGRDDVVAVLSALVDLPAEYLTLSPTDRVRAVDRGLRERIFGQDRNLSSLTRVIGQNWARFGSRRPLASFAFGGAQGSGKRATAVALAELLFGSPQAMLEIDLADYGEPHSLSHLIGSPPGYVGHEEGGLLSDTLTRRPFLLVLWHHPEQAHASVTSLLAQILSEGTVTDRKGRRMDFRNSVQVLACSTQELGGSGRGVGFSPGHAAESEEAVAVARVRKSLPPDLVPHLDAVLHFGPPDAGVLESIATRALALAVAGFGDEHGVPLAAGPDVASAVARMALRRGANGAAVDAVLAEQILRPASDAVFAGTVPASGLVVRSVGDALVIDGAEEA